MITITNSPDINLLAFAAVFDISTVTPTISLNNQSSGPDLAGCKWWYVIQTPSGTYIHQGSATSPDITGNWSSITVSDVWPQPMGTIEFSGAPYTIELFVQDTADNVYSEKLSQEICRPSGMTANSGNFGAAVVAMDVLCDKAKMLVNDITNYVYKGNSGQQISKSFIVDYPLDGTGSRPRQFVANDFTNVIVPVPFSSNGYTMFVNSIFNYPFSSGITVKVKYKLIKDFPIQCGIDLCPLVCSFHDLIQDIENGRCKWNFEDQKSKLELITSKLTLALIAKEQPACSIDLPKLIEEIKVLGGFDCNCYISGNGNNGQIADNDLNFTVSANCGDISGNAVKVGDNVTINLSDFSYVFSICNGTSGAFTVTPGTGPNCTKTFCLGVDLAQLKTDLNIATYQPICVSVYEHGINPNTPPVACPLSYFPAYIWDYTNANVIGLANSSSDMIAILNADATWNVNGTAYLTGNCSVCFSPVPLVVSINPVFVTLYVPGNPPPQPTNYTVQVQDYCNAPQLKPLNSFPQNVYVSYTNGGTLYPVGYCVDYNDMITKLAAETHKPGYIVMTAASNTNPLFILVNVADSNVPANKHVNIFGDKANIILIGSNGNIGSPASTTTGNADEVYIDTNARIGSICAITTPFNKPWHAMAAFNRYLTIETDTGAIRVADITDPLNPIVLAGYSLAGLIGPPTSFNTPFSGIPNYPGAIPSYWNAYFPTDYNAQLQGTVTYIVESTGGTIYKYDTATNTLIAFFYNSTFMGSCPRVIFDLPNPITGVNSKLYSTRDGFRGTLTGAGSLNPIPAGAITYADLTVFGVSATYFAMVDPGEDIWAMSIDPAQSGVAYLTSTSGNIYKYDMNTDAVLAVYPTVTPSLTTAKFINTSINNGRIFISAYGIGTFQCQLSNLGPGSAVVFDPLPTTPGPNVNHLNFRPLPNSCMGILTFDNGTNPGGVAKYTLDGTYLGLIQFPGSIYNVVPVQNITSSTPNTLCP